MNEPGGKSKCHSSILRGRDTCNLIVYPVETPGSGQEEEALNIESQYLLQSRDHMTTTAHI